MINTQFSTVFSLITAAGGIILVIVAIVEFNKVSSYIPAQCFVLSSEVSSNYGSSGFGRLMYRAIWSIILTDSDGINAATSVWSSTSESYPAWSMYNLQAQYLPNNTYQCYHQRGSLYPTQIQFNQPSKAKAIGCLIGGLLVIIFGIVIYGVGTYYRSRNYQRRSQQQYDAQASPTTTETRFASQPPQDLVPISIVNPNYVASISYPAVTTIEEGQQRENSVPPPSYDEAVQHMAPSSSSSFDNFFDRLGFRRQTSNMTRLEN